MRPQPACCGLDVGDEVLGLLEVDPRLGAELHAQITLLRAGVDREHTQTHRDGVLHGEVTEPATGAWQDDPLADVRVAVFDGAVDGDALSDW